MSYCEVSDIESEFKNLKFTSDTLVTVSDIQGFIAEYDALINAYVGAKYVTPITADEDSVTLMRLFSRTLTADRVKKRLEVKQDTNKSANQDVRGAYSTKDVMASLNAIKKGELPLSGATLLLNSGQGTFYSENVENNVTPVFQKDVDQW